MTKQISEFVNKIICGDCVKVMNTIPEKSVDLIFADPPYNIGLKYDNHKDNMPYEEYLNWTEKWITACLRVLKDTGSIYIAIGDEYAAEVVSILKKKGLSMRNWIIWHYTFGQNQRKKFSRAHTHIIYFTKDQTNFTFNSDDIRVKSVRQKIGDKRANPKGKIPDDVWKISRVAGTFKERVKNFPCQMPLALLERVIKASSNAGDIVLDPFIGSGTTAVASKKLGRKYIGIDISPNYVKNVENRLKSML
jgi:site-specific DNA-methyltransferase (adenine-specific)